MITYLTDDYLKEEDNDMSQEKVDRHKLEKANRRKTIAKQKRNAIVGKIIFILIIAALVVWAVFSIRNWMINNAEVVKTVVDLSPITDYISSISSN